MKSKKIPWKKPKKPERLMTAATYLKGRNKLCMEGNANCKACPLGTPDDGNCVQIEIQKPDLAIAIVAAWLAQEEAGHENS